ncbi:MAG: ribonuclease PH [Chthoniobacteraceae bacterium]|nr:ribonuclease PH [Chthoniobacteraceae bacterium]
MTMPNSPFAALRADNRQPDQLRPLSFTPHFAPHATGSVLAAFGNTRVICSATIQPDIPRWMKEQKVPGGWLTAEYSMLPYSTLDRKPRDISKGKLDGRSSEIQRLIGRALRAAIDLRALGPNTLWIDCDVLQADGGTRTASITGACIASALAFERLVREKKLARSPMKALVAAVSVGVVGGVPMLDLAYTEDKEASVDMNLVMTEKLEFVELQGSGEEAVFTDGELEALLTLGRKGVRELITAQQTAIQTGIATPAA